MTITFKDDEQNAKLARLREDEEEDLAQILAERNGVTYRDLRKSPINPDALRLISEEDSLKYDMVVFDVNGKKLEVGIASPQNEHLKEFLISLENKGFSLNVYVVSKNSLTKAREKYKDLSYAAVTKKGVLTISDNDISGMLDRLKTVADIKKEIGAIVGQKQNYQVSQIVEILLAGALSVGASDVHIEPEETFIRVRFRLSGVLTNIIEFDRRVYTLIVSRIKLLSGLKLNIKEAAQDGRFSIKMGDSNIEIRTSILPGGFGESIVMRLLNPKSISVPLESLGMEPYFLEIIYREIEKPNGMIINTGPTGSGKTTSLYAFLKKVHTPDIKIITIEDPIEYHIEGLVQTQVEREKGYNFSDGLRAALRQDPDIIMVGEIRDGETADIAVNSALTGHLVFSTLHTNNAAGTFPRLGNLGINPQILGSAVNLAMAQRLIRKLCPDCKKPVKATPEEAILLQKLYDRITNEDIKKNISVPENVCVAVGCDKCNGSGYKGRLGIYEAILMDDKIEEIIKFSSSEREIREAARHQKILTLEQDAAVKIMRCDSSFEEVGRVIDLEQEIIEAEQYKKESAVATPDPLSV